MIVRGTRWVLPLAFTVLGAMVVYLRTRYAMSVYIVIFGSIVVAAYKMGMVHERPLVIVKIGLAIKSSARASAPVLNTVFIEGLLQAFAVRVRRRVRVRARLPVSACKQTPATV